MSAPAVTCAGLVHVYRVAGTDIAALRGVDLTVAEGQKVAILGPSGSGKSTLLQILAGILRPSAGRAELLGTDLAAASPGAVERLRGTAMGVMLQGAATNLLLHEDVRGNLAALLGPRGRSSAAERVLAAGGLADEHRVCGALSPSEQQTVALALAMAREPKVLLIDEPTSRLDAGARDRLLDQLVAVTTEHRTAVVLVTHDEHVARRMDRMIHLRDGRIGEEVTATGRYAVLAADGSVAIPSALLGAGWTPGALIEVQQDGDAIRLRPVGMQEGA